MIVECKNIHVYRNHPDSKVQGANMGPLGPCRPKMGPMLAPWTLLSGHRSVDYNMYWEPLAYAYGIYCVLLGNDS